MPTDLNEFLDNAGHERNGVFFNEIQQVSDDGNTMLVFSMSDYSRYRIRLNFSTRGSESNLLANGDFDNSWNAWELSRWERTLTKEKKLVEAPGFLGERAAKIRMGNMAGDPNSLFLKQEGLRLEPNTEYYLSFTVKASKPGTAEVKLVNDGNTFQSYGLEEEVELATDWETHVIEFRSNGFGEPVSNGRLQFQFKRGGYKSVLYFYVDEVAIHKK